MLRYCLNVLMGLSFIVLVLTGLLKFPEVQIFLGSFNYPLPWRTLSYLHDWSGVVLGVLIAVHLCLNWKWFTAETKNLFFKKK